MMNLVGGLWNPYNQSQIQTSGAQGSAAASAVDWLAMASGGAGSADGGLGTLFNASDATQTSSSPASGSGDYATAFQQFDAGIQSLLLQLQATLAADSQNASGAAAGSGSGGAQGVAGTAASTTASTTGGGATTPNPLTAAATDADGDSDGSAASAVRGAGGHHRHHGGALAALLAQLGNTTTNANGQTTDAFSPANSLADTLFGTSGSSTAASATGATNAPTTTSGRTPGSASADGGSGSPIAQAQWLFNPFAQEMMQAAQAYASGQTPPTGTNTVPATVAVA